MKRILVPVDFSPAMEGVVALAGQMARAFEAEVHLVHVREIASVPVFPATAIGYPGVALPELSLGGGAPGTLGLLEGNTIPNEQRTSPLATLQQQLDHSGLTAFAHEREGAVVDEILQAASEISAHLIVMGSHGHGSVYNLLVGSVTEGVLQAAKRPVLLVPAPTVAS